MSVSDAAERIGVTDRQVRNLAAQGSIRLLARGVVDSDSVAAYLRERGEVTTKVWSEATAWAAIGVLAGLDTGLVSDTRVHQLRRRIATMTSSEFASRVRNRARIERFIGHRSVVDRVADDLVRGDPTIANLSVKRATDGYTDQVTASKLVDHFRLRADTAGEIVLRVTDHLAVVERIAEHRGDLLTAVDLATSIDVREKAADRTVLDAALKAT